MGVQTVGKMIAPLALAGAAHLSAAEERLESKWSEPGFKGSVREEIGGAFIAGAFWMYKHLKTEPAAAISDQPPPVATYRRPAWDLVREAVQQRYDLASAYVKDGTLDLVLADMAERDQTGRQRYGVPLTSGNGRNHLVDAYQEALDFAVYLAAYLDEHKAPLVSKFEAEIWSVFCVRGAFWDHMRAVMRLRAIIRAEGKE